MLEVEDVPNIRPAAHGTNALELSDGSLLALWYCGSYEGAEDQRIAASVKRQDGAWESPRVVVDRFEFEGGAWIPEIGVPVPLQDGSLSIYFWATPLASFTLRGDPPRWVRSIPASRVFSTTLSPLGWGAEATQMTAPESLPALSGERGLVLQGSALKTTSGRWILPFHSENEQCWFHSRFLVSDDEGTSWQTRGDLHAGPGCLEPALAQLPSGEILCYLRRGAKMGHIWRAVSWDDGDTWSDPVPTNLRNPHSGVDIAVGAAGRLLIAYNDSYSLRTPLCVGLSQDGGRTFRVRDVEVEEGEYSYPKLLQTRDGAWRLFYTHQRAHVRHAWFAESWLEGGRKVVGLDEAP